jgi:hypothetical protein
MNIKAELEAIERQIDALEEKVYGGGDWTEKEILRDITNVLMALAAVHHALDNLPQAQAVQAKGGAVVDQFGYSVSLN